MARQTFCALVILLSLAFLEGVSAQSEQQQKDSKKPAASHQGGEQRKQGPWLWWGDKFRAEVGFSLAQAAEIEKIFNVYVENAQPLRKELNELDKAIEKMLVGASSDLAVFTHTVEKAEARRAELNKMRTVMFYRFRRVLTPEQNAKFRAATERWEAERKKRDSDRHK